MTTLLLIRHGESMANTEKKFAGFLNVPLSPLGESQAQTTAAYIHANRTVDAVYASDLARAFDTGKAVADHFGLPIHPEPDLREICAGEWEGAVFDELPTLFPESYQRWLTDIGNASCDGGESVAELQQRVVAALYRIAKENDGKTVVIATHATPIRVFQCHCAGKPLGDMNTLPWVTNASITEVAYDNGSFRLVRVGDDSHLGTSRTALPANV